MPKTIMIKPNKKLWKAVLYCNLLFAACCLFSSCVTVSTRESLSVYSLNGTSYLPLIPLCQQKGVSWQYDAFAKTVTLTKGPHKINLMPGDTLVLIDGQSLHLKHPVEVYQGRIVVPYRFKEQVFDSLSKESYPRQEAVSSLKKIQKVVIDAGHGGNDPGAVGRTGLREKDVNLDIAKRLSSLLKAKGIKVVMARATDTFISLARRAQIANDANADFFISIHSNANRVRSLNGFEVYYVAGGISDDSKRAYLAAKSAALDLDPLCFASQSLDLKAILWDMVYTYSRAESISLAKQLCRAIGNNLDVRVIGIKSARFEVLRSARLPAVLIETGFLSNSKEERMLKNSYFRQKIAESIAEGICNYAQDERLTEIAKR